MTHIKHYDMHKQDTVTQIHRKNTYIPHYKVSHDFTKNSLSCPLYPEQLYGHQKTHGSVFLTISSKYVQIVCMKSHQPCMSKMQDPKSVPTSSSFQGSQNSTSFHLLSVGNLHLPLYNKSQT